MTENKHCTAFDYAYNTKYKPFIEVLIKHCLTRAAVKRSLILPSPSSLKAIKAIKDSKEQLIAIQKYILRTAVSPERIKEIGTKGGKVYSLFRKDFYPVEYKDEKIYLNGIKVDVVMELASHTTLYKASKKLVSMTMMSEEKKEGGKKMVAKKRKKTIGTNAFLKTIIL